jgi:prepilin-type N-terminal cleavage/methylation domain-containing protein
MYRSKGFTLLEIGIVLFVIGILISLFLPMYTQGIKNSGNVTKVVVFAQKINTYISTIAQECNLSVTNAFTSLPDSSASKTIYDVINDGSASVASGYRGCFTKANVSPMGNAFKFDGAAWYYGTYRIVLSTVVIPTSNKTTVQSAIYNMPAEEIILVMNQYAGQHITTLAGFGDSSHPNYQWINFGAPLLFIKPTPI